MGTPRQITRARARYYGSNRKCMDSQQSSMALRCRVEAQLAYTLTRIGETLLRADANVTDCRQSWLWLQVQYDENGGPRGIDCFEASSELQSRLWKPLPTGS